MLREVLLQSDCDPRMVERVAQLNPTNPLCTPEYVESLRLQGRTPWMIGESSGGQLVWGAVAVLETGRLTRKLNIVSVDTTAVSQEFWQNLYSECRPRGIDKLRVGSSASLRTTIPHLPQEISRSLRKEYVLDLLVDNLWDRLSKNHQRNIRKAQKLGVRFEATTEEPAVAAHVRLQTASMSRRSGRGESVSEGFSTRAISAYLKTGAGTIYQAWLGDELQSSVVVMTSRKGAYYQSAGTAPGGMSSGASHALVYEICQRLQAHSVERFSLGGVNADNEGLERFKACFGAEALRLDSGEFCFRNGYAKLLFSSAARIANESRHLIRNGMSRGYWWLKKGIKRCSPLALIQGSKEVLVDWRYACDTKAIVEKCDLKSVGPNLQYAVRYQPSSLRFVRRQIEELKLDCSDYTFVDLGSGKGRVLLEAASFPFRSVIGIEFSSALHAIAEKNVASWKASSALNSEVHLLCMDAAEFQLPNCNLVLYLYNPFDSVVLERVLANIQSSLRAHPRQVVIIYLNPKCRDVLNASDSLRLVRQGKWQHDEFRVYCSKLVNAVASIESPIPHRGNPR